MDIKKLNFVEHCLRCTFEVLWLQLGGSSQVPLARGSFVLGIN